jgi:hypothetical protein
MIARGRPRRFVRALHPAEDFDGLVRLNERSGKIRRIFGCPHELHDVPRVQGEGQSPARSRRHHAAPRYDGAGGRQPHGHDGRILGGRDHEIARFPILRGTRPGRHSVVSRHCGARKEERGVVGEGVATGRSRVVDARGMAGAKTPIFARRAAERLIFERVELIDGHRDGRHEVIRRPPSEHGVGQRFGLAASVRVGSLESGDPRQIDLGKRVRENGGRLIDASWPGHSDLGRGPLRVGHDHREVEDGPDRIGHDGRPIVAAYVRLGGLGLGAGYGSLVRPRGVSQIDRGIGDPRRVLVLRGVDPLDGKEAVGGASTAVDQKESEGRGWRGKVARLAHDQKA